MGIRGSVVESDFCTKVQYLEVHEAPRKEERQTLRPLCDTGMRSTRSGDSVLPPASARTYESNYKEIVVPVHIPNNWNNVHGTTMKEEHTFIERQSWGHQTIAESGR